MTSRGPAPDRRRAAGPGSPHSTAGDVLRDTTEQLDDCLIDALVQLSFVVQKVIGRIAEAQEMSITQVRLLAVLEDRQIGVKELSGILELGKSATSGLVSRAERRGLVRRHEVPEDARAVQVGLTPAGRAMTRSVRREVRADLTGLAVALAPADRDRLPGLVQPLVDEYFAQHLVNPTS